MELRIVLRLCNIGATGGMVLIAAGVYGHDWLAFALMVVAVVWFAAITVREW